MADLNIRFVTKRRLDHKIEPGITERTVPVEFAENVMDAFMKAGIAKASEMVEMVSREYRHAVVFAIAKALLNASAFARKQAGMLDVPVVILDEKGRALDVENVPVTMQDAEHVAARAWEDYEGTVRDLMAALNGNAYEATQIVDEIFKYLY